MKKLLWILLASLTLFISCGQINSNENKNTDETAVLEINLGKSSRTVTAIKKLSVSAVKSWNISLTDIKGNTTESVLTPVDGKLSLQVVPGTYDIEIEGNVKTASSQYTLYGKKADCVITTKGAKVSILVGLKKSENGKGNFTYELTITDEEIIADTEDSEIEKIDDLSLSIGSYVFSSCLTDFNSTDEENSIIALSMTGKNEDGKLILNLSKEGLSSGYYALSVMLTSSKNEDVISVSLPLSDVLVEISDDLTTTGSCSLSKIEDTSRKIIYVTDDATAADKNGYSPNNAKEMDSAIEWLDSNRHEWQTAVLYYSGTSVFPPYNVAVNPTEPGDSKKVIVYNIVEDDYIEPSIVLKSGQIHVPSVELFEDGEISPSIAINLVSKDGIKDVVVYANEDIKDLSFYTDKVRVTVDNYSREPALYEIWLNAKGISTDYSKDSLPVLTVNLSESFESEFPEEWIYYDDPDDSEYSVFISMNEERNQVKAYTCKIGKVNVALLQALAEFSVSYSSTSTDIEKIFTATEISGAEYTWYINDNKVAGETSNILTIDTYTNEYLLAGQNIIKCICKLGNEYASAYVFEIL